MKVLYHHRTQAEDAQGVHIAEMIRAFRELGHAVDVVGLVPLPAARGGRAPAGPWPLVKRWAPPWLYESLALGYNLYGYRTLARRIHARRPDVIYERYSLNTACGVWASRRFGIPLVLEVNAPLSYELRALGQLTFAGLARAAERWICSHATRTIVVSRVMRDMLVREGVPAARIAVVPNGIDPREFHPGVPGEPIRERYGLADRLVIGFVGWFRQWHGLDVLLDAFEQARLAERGVRALFVGDGPAADELRSRVRAGGLGDAVVFTGAIARDEVASHIAAMDIAVQPSATAYACPMKLVEYMAMGRCIVAPDQPNIRELVDDGVTARLFIPGDRKSLQSALVTLVDAPELRRTLAERARDRVFDRRMSWRANAERALALAGLAVPTTTSPGTRV